MNAVPCRCGNIIIGKGERVECDNCGTVLWLTTVDDRTNITENND